MMKKVTSTKALSLREVVRAIEAGRLPEDFRRISERVPVYSSRSRGIVLKRGHFILDVPPSSVRVPTRKVANTDWTIQPIVARVFLRDAVRVIRSKLPKGVFPDLHTGNVGWLNGRAVMFDW